MFERLKVTWISGVTIFLFFWGLSGTILLAQNKQEIVVTIKGISTGDKLTHFNKGEELRKRMKFSEAIEEYKQVIAPGELCGKEAEAHYNIGLCYTWLGKVVAAEAVFQEVLKTYPDDAEVVAYTKLCFSWIDVQRRNFDAAINRLQQTLDENLYSGEECCSVAQFHIGRIYLLYLHDYERAEAAFRKVLEKYPNSKITQHPFLEKVKGE